MLTLLPADVVPNSADCIEESFGHWFAGFFDGEGSLQVQQVNSRQGPRPSGYKSYGCRAVIQLRADDRPILEEIAARFGIGRLYYYEGGSNANRNPRSRWQVQSKQECLKLAAIFDRFPLRAKKARDYVIWRRALMVWVELPHAGGRNDIGGVNAAALLPLKCALESGRVFAPVAVDGKAR